jgi:hypothetical protein
LLLGPDGLPDTLIFDDVAQQVRDVFAVWCRDLSEKWSGIRPQIGAAVRKLDRFFGRLCVTLHCVEHAAAYHAKCSGPFASAQAPPIGPPPKVIPVRIAAMAANFI